MLFLTQNSKLNSVSISRIMHNHLRDTGIKQTGAVFATFIITSKAALTDTFPNDF